MYLGMYECICVCVCVTNSGLHLVSISQFLTCNSCSLLVLVAYLVQLLARVKEKAVEFG